MWKTGLWRPRKMGIQCCPRISEHRQTWPWDTCCRDHWRDKLWSCEEDQLDFRQGPWGHWEREHLWHYLWCPVGCQPCEEFREFEEVRSSPPYNTPKGMRSMYLCSTDECVRLPTCPWAQPRASRSTRPLPVPSPRACSSSSPPETNTKTQGQSRQHQNH